MSFAVQIMSRDCMYFTMEESKFGPESILATEQQTKWKQGLDIVLGFLLL